MTETAAERRQGRKDKRRNDILDAAEELLAERGYHEMGIADIAKKLGIGHGTFYRYFDNKRDIALSVLERGVQDFANIGVAVNPAATNSLPEYRAQVEGIIDGWLDFAAARPRLMQVLLEQAHIIDVERLRQMNDLYTNITAAFLHNGVDKGFLRQDLEIIPTAEMLLGLIFAGCRRALFDPDEDKRRRWAKAGVALMFDGIGVQGAA